MKKRTITVNIGAVCLLLLAAGCDKKAAEPQSPIAATPAPATSEPLLSHWQKFSSDAGKFSVLLPSAPQEKVTPLPTQYGEIPLHTFISEIDKLNAYAAAYFDYPATVDLSDSKKVFAATIEQFSGKGYKVDSQTEEKLDEYPAMQFAVSKGNFKITEKQILVGHRLYQLSSVFSADNPHPQDLAAFFASFSLLKPSP